MICWLIKYMDLEIVLATICNFSYMIISIWKIRGLNQGHKQKELKLFLNKHRVDIVSCLETRVKEHRASKIKRKLAQGWLSAHNYNEDTNGSIWVLWKSHLKVQIIEIHEQYIHYMVEDPGMQINLYITIVYARNELTKKDIMWHDIMQITLQH